MFKKGLFVILALLMLGSLFAAGCAQEEEVVEGEILEFTLSYPTGNVAREQHAELIAEDLAKVGIKVNLDIMEFSTLSDKVYDEGDFDAYLMGWGLAADPDSSVIWGADTAWNAVGFDHPDNFRLLAEGRAVVDIDERKPIYREWQALLYEECPYVWLYAGNEAYVYNNRLQNFAPNPFAIWWDVEKWHVTEGPDEIIFAIWSAPDGVFNLNLYESRYDADSMEPVFEGMLRYNPDLTFQPGLADEWEISDDGLEFYFKLRDDVYFHDGVQVTTADVLFTFEWMAHPDYTGVRASNWENLVGFAEFQAGDTDTLEGIEVINDQEIKFHFTQVDAPAFGNVATWAISPKHVFEGTAIEDLENHPAITAPIGAGPFKFSRYEEGQFVELVKFEDYHNGAPQLDKIIINVANPDVAVVSLLTEEIDTAWMMPNADDWAEFDTAAHLGIIEYPQNGYQYMGLKMDHEHLQNKLVRQAMTYAINREAMVEGLLDGMGIIQVSHMASVSWAYDPNIVPYPYDPDKAIELLKEAGYVMNADGWMVMPYEQ